MFSIISTYNNKTISSNEKLIKLEEKLLTYKLNKNLANVGFLINKKIVNNIVDMAILMQEWHFSFSGSTESIRLKLFRLILTFQTVLMNM